MSGGGDKQKRWDQLLDKLRSRRWEVNSTAWLQHIPALGQKLDSATLSEYFTNEELLPLEHKKNEIFYYNADLSSVASILFNEAIMWMHKSLHILGAAEHHLELGIKTWSLSSAYQSAYCAQRAISCFFGVSTFEIGKVSYIVDICDDTKNLRPQNIPRRFSEKVKIHSLGELLQQKQSWEVFQRIIRISNSELWSRQWGHYLGRLDTKRITQQRHRLHYEAAFWEWNDLHEFDYDRLVLEVPDISSDLPINTALPEYIFHLSSGLLKMTFDLYLSISNKTELLSSTTANLDRVVEQRHPIYGGSLRNVLYDSTRKRKEGSSSRAAI